MRREPLIHFVITFFKFGVAGLIGMIVDFGTTWILKDKVGINRYIANAIGFSLAVTNNYIINRTWTFGSEKNWLPEFIRFLLFSLCGLLLNHLVLSFFHNRKNASFWLAKSIATACVLFWNFFTNFLFNF